MPAAFRCCDCVVPCCESACRVSLPAACRRCVLRCAAVVCCRAVPPCCCERVRCARVMYTIVRMLGLCLGDGSVQSVRVAGNAQVLTLLMLWITVLAARRESCSQRASRGCSGRRGLRRARHGVARFACSVSHGAAVGIKVSAGLLVLTSLF